MATRKTAQKKRGRKPQADSKSGKIRELLKTGAKPMDIAKQVGCTPALVYNTRARRAGGPTKKAGGKGMPSTKARSSGVGGVDLNALVESVRSGERDRDQMRRALEQIQAVVQSVLA